MFEIFEWFETSIFDDLKCFNERSVWMFECSDVLMNELFPCMKLWMSQCLDDSWLEIFYCLNIWNVRMLEMAECKIFLIIWMFEPIKYFAA